MISHKCYSNPQVLMMRSKVSKNSSRDFQVSSEINFLISVRKTLPTSVQTVDLASKKFWFGTNPQMGSLSKQKRRHNSAAYSGPGYIILNPDRVGSGLASVNSGSVSCGRSRRTGKGDESARSYIKPGHLSFAWHVQMDPHVCLCLEVSCHFSFC